MKSEQMFISYLEPRLRSLGFNVTKVGKGVFYFNKEARNGDESENYKYNSRTDALQDIDLYKSYTVGILKILYILGISNKDVPPNKSKEDMVKNYVFPIIKERGYTIERHINYSYLVYKYDKAFRYYPSTGKAIKNESYELGLLLIYFDI